MSVFIVGTCSASANPPKKLKAAYKAYLAYDYFKARQFFYELNSKNYQAGACYGLSQLALRNDNPFHSLDTALRYANLAYQSFKIEALPIQVESFTIDSNSIRALIDTVALKNLQLVKKLKSVAICERFLRDNYLCKKKYVLEVVYLRDELDFNNTLSAYKSDSTRHFITTHPQSLFLKEAYVLLDRQVYDESTVNTTEAEYLAFVRRQPKSMMLNTAYEQLFTGYKRTKDVKGLANFVAEFPAAPQNLEAWKLLFSLSVKAYTFADLKKFVDEYPQFPLKNSILKDLELNKLQLYPIQMGDFAGYIDELGHIKIAPQYDEAFEFSDGLAVVNKNDSVFYINKENVNPFEKFFENAYSFHSGIAAVKEKGKWVFINRQGQVISNAYDELQELSGAAYVFKQAEQFGAVDQYAQALIAAQFEKLGDFKNGFAYYVDKGLYGFVSREGVVHSPEFEWISDFNEEQLAVVKKNGRYGLLNSAGQSILNCAYDQIIRTRGRVYIVVSNNQYGFYSFDGCFIQHIQYDFLREKGPEFYSDGSYFRLIKKSEQTLVDANGKAVLTPQQAEDFGFLSETLIRVKTKGKWGYLDNRFTQHIATKYITAEDFEGGVAIVSSKDTRQLINAVGESVYETKNEITRINEKWFIENQEEGKALLDKRGNVLAHNIEEVAPLGHFGWILRLAGGEIKLIND